MFAPKQIARLKTNDNNLWRRAIIILQCEHCIALDCKQHRNNDTVENVTVFMKSI